MAKSADILSGGLKDWKANPKSGEVQTFDQTAVMTAAEKDENETKQHVVPGPDHNNLGAKNDLHS